jgi:hypothetical protein
LLWHCQGNWSFSIASPQIFCCCNNLFFIQPSTCLHLPMFVNLLVILLDFSTNYHPTCICFYLQTSLWLCWIACAHEPTPTYEPMWGLWEAKWSYCYITSLQQSSKVTMKLGNWYLNIFLWINKHL